MADAPPGFQARLPRGATVHALWVVPLVAALTLLWLRPWEGGTPLALRAQAAMEAQEAQAAQRAAQEAERAGTAAARAGAVMPIEALPASAATPASR